MQTEQLYGKERAHLMRVLFKSIQESLEVLQACEKVYGLSKEDIGALDAADMILERAAKYVKTDPEAIEAIREAGIEIGY